MKETRTVQVLLLAETILFLSAATAHFTILSSGNPDTAAGTAETVIGLVLLAGLITTIVREPLTRNAGLVAQLLALLGTLVGVFTIIVGVGPRTVIDVIIHTAMLALLGSGLVFTRRTMTVHNPAGTVR